MSLLTKIIILCLLLCGSAFARDWVPSGTHRWYNADLDKTRIHGGGPPYNYRDPADGVWKATDLMWVVSGGNLINITNGHRSRINGTTNIVEYEFKGHIVRQRAFALFAYRRSTHQRVMLDNTPDFSNRTFFDSVVTYTDIFPGIDLEIVNGLGSLTFHWVFHQSARDAFGTWWAANGSPTDAYWAVASRFDIDDLGQGITLHDSTGRIDVSVDLDIKRRMDFMEDGRRVFHSPPEMLDQFLPPTGDGETIQWPVYRRIVHISNKKYLIEGIKWTDAQQVPAGDISHNTQFGISTIYGSTSHTGNRHRVLLASPASTGTIDSIVSYRYGTSGVFHCAVYNEAGTSLIDSSTESASQQFVWVQQAAVLGGSITASTNYLIVQWGNSTADGTRVGVEAGFTRYLNTGQTYGAWAGTMGKNSPTVDEAYSMYVVYTIDGEPAADISYVRRIKEGEGK